MKIGRVKRLLTSCFGLGYLPIAPGTWGSMAPVAIFILALFLRVTADAITAIITAIIILASIVCVKFSSEAIKVTGKNDPSEVVADEVAGQAIAFLGIYPTETKMIFITALVGFLAFRLFDILKPWPICKLEKLPGGWGIWADDILAGLYAWAVLQIFSRIFMI